MGQEPVFQKNVQALLNASLFEDTKEEVIDHLRRYAKRILEVELQDQTPKQSILDKKLSTITTAFITAVSVSVADSSDPDRPAFKELIETIIDDFLEMRQVSLQGEPPQRIRQNGNNILQAFFSSFFALCYEEDWRRKLAGCTGLQILTSRGTLEAKWTVDRQLEFVRAIFFALRDAPKDPPRSLSDVVDLLKSIITKCNQDEAGVVRLNKLIDMLVLELPSQKSVVREATQACIELLAEIKGLSVHDLIVKAAKERLLDPNSGPIFNKPLRALPFGMQIGNIDAITYLLNLRPPLPDVNDELMRLVHETIALADADDASLIGRVVHHAAELSLRNLRVACLKLLCAAMSFPDLFSKQHASRSRYIWHGTV